MVRIISQNFSPQRSRHSSGETDRYLAERASSALGLSVFGKKRLDLPECESSSDSFWDSELDGDHHDAVYSEHGEDNNDINGNETLKKSAAQSKRKERRRERNKLSAQAYRQRRRSQNMKEQQQLLMLETENKRLHQLVETLEKKTEQTKQFLRGCSVPMPDVLLPPSSVEAAAACGETASSPDMQDFSHLHPHSPTAATSAQSSACDETPTSCFGPSQRTDSPHPQVAGSSLSLLSNINLGDTKLSKRSHASNTNDKRVPPGASASHAQGNNHAAKPKPLSHPQIFVNANALMHSQLQASTQSGVSAFVVPALMAIPVEYNSAVTNYNLNSPAHNKKSQMMPQSAMSTEEKNCVATAPIMWSINGNPPPAGAVYSLMNVEMCDNNSLSGNLNSNHVVNNKGIITACDNKHSSAAPGSPVTVNLNEVKISGEPLQFWQAQHGYSRLSH